jgi:hypothetical protein
LTKKVRRRIHKQRYSHRIEHDCEPQPEAHTLAAAERSDLFTIDANELRSALGLIAENLCGEKAHDPINRAANVICFRLLHEETPLAV